MEWMSVETCDAADPFSALPSPCSHHSSNGWKETNSLFDVVGSISFTACSSCSSVTAIPRSDGPYTHTVSSRALVVPPVRPPSRACLEPLPRGQNKNVRWGVGVRTVREHTKIVHRDPVVMLAADDINPLEEALGRQVGLRRFRQHEQRGLCGGEDPPEPDGAAEVALLVVGGGGVILPPFHNRVQRHCALQANRGFFRHPAGGLWRRRRAGGGRQRCLAAARRVRGERPGSGRNARWGQAFGAHGAAGAADMVKDELELVGFHVHAEHDLRERGRPHGSAVAERFSGVAGLGASAAGRGAAQRQRHHSRSQR